MIDVFIPNTAFSILKMLIDGLESCFLLSVWILILMAPIHDRGSMMSKRCNAQFPQICLFLNDLKH